MKNIELLQELETRIEDLVDLRNVIENLDDVNNDQRIEIVQEIDYFLYNLDNRMMFTTKDAGLQRESEDIEVYLEELNEWLQWR